MTGAGYAAWGTKINYNNTMRTAEWNVFVQDKCELNMFTNDDIFGTNDMAQTFSVSNGKYINIKDTYVERYQSKEYGKFDVENSGDLSGASKGNTKNYVYSIKPNIGTSVEQNDTVNFKFYNMHPGTKVLTYFEIKNGGTIPAKISDIKVTLNNNNMLSDELKYLVDAIKVDGEFYDNTQVGLSSDIDFLGSLESISLSQLEEKLEKIFVGKYVLGADHVVRPFGLEKTSEMENGLTFSIPVDKLKINGHNVATLEELKVKIEFDFVQYNQNVPDTKK
jgi:hypothetical protein